MQHSQAAVRPQRLRGAPCRYCKTEVVGAALQEVIYNALPEYQQGLLYDPVAGPNAQARVVCRDSEAILDSIPQCAPTPPPPVWC